MRDWTWQPANMEARTQLSHWNITMGILFAMFAAFRRKRQLTRGYSCSYFHHLNTYLLYFAHSRTSKVCHEKNVSNSGAYISVGIHFTENLKVPAERLWKIQFFDIWYIFVGQILLGLHQSNQLLRYWIISNLLLWNAVL